MRSMPSFVGTCVPWIRLLDVGWKSSPLWNTSKRIRNAQSEIIIIFDKLKWTVLSQHWDRGHPNKIGGCGLRAECVVPSSMVVCASAFKGKKKKKTKPVGNSTSALMCMDYKVFKSFQEWALMSILSPGQIRGYKLSYRKCFVHMWWVNSKMSIPSKLLRFILLDLKFHSLGYSSIILMYHFYGPLTGNAKRSRNTRGH